jgi:hypothetical protein
MISLDDREVELLILALRFWRSHRRDGAMRPTDPSIAPTTIDALLAKLRSATPPSTFPPDDPFESLNELFPL